MHISAARGAILEELVLHLLALVGYRVVKADAEGTREGHSGLEVKGRGAWHQIDALAAFDRTPAFMYPLRLMVEAKCYSANAPVEIGVVRNSVGVLKDIVENFFTFRPSEGDQTEIPVPRFNYHAAIFSTSGYSSAAQRYAMAHQVFLIQYSRIRVLEPVIQGLLALNQSHLSKKDALPNHKTMSALLREELRQMLTHGEVPVSSQFNILNPAGRRHVRENIVTPLLAIHGSYFGMLQGRWPMHLLAYKSLPPTAFADQDEVLCRLYGRESDRWAFVPVNAQEGDPNWFRLEFDIPAEILEMVEAARDDKVAIANVKKEQFSTLDLAGKIDGILRQIRLRVDEDWLKSYLERIRKKAQ
jgi:hypothetical protein